MSYIDIVPSRPPQQRSAWRWFPWWLAGAMAMVFAVNGYMIFAALETFPGVAGRDGFDLSNSYDRVLDVAAREAALGWKLDARAGAAGHASITLTDRAGAALQGAQVTARAERPLGPRMDLPITFRDAGQGRYEAQQVLPEKGQWDLLLSATVEDRSTSATRRVVVR